MLLLARTTPLPNVTKKSDGLSVFLVELTTRSRRGMTVRPIRNMVGHETNEVFFDDFEVPAENLIGEEGKGFRYILDGMNAERILIAAECIGDGYWFVDSARTYAYERDRVRSADRPEPGHPVSDRRAPTPTCARRTSCATRRRDCSTPAQPCGGEANMAKLLAADASWEAANVCLQTLRRLRLCGRVRRRAQVPRDAALSGRTDLDESDPLVHRRARARLPRSF